MEKALVLNEKQAREYYPQAPAVIKAALETAWGKPFFEQKITDRIKTVKDACIATGKDYEALVKLCSLLSPDTAAYEQLKVVNEALNEGWLPDWNKNTQYKWYPWFKMYAGSDNPSGFGLRDSGCVYSSSTVGSRLVFKSEELSTYAATQFIDLYRLFFQL